MTHGNSVFSAEVSIQKLFDCDEFLVKTHSKHSDNMVFELNVVLLGDEAGSNIGPISLKSHVRTE